mgnify:CR=1 FL=1
MMQMVCGGIYEFTDHTGVVVRGTMIGTEALPNGTVRGTYLRHGHAPEVVVHGTERWGHLTLVGRPASPNIGRPRKKE